MAGHSRYLFGKTNDIIVPVRGKVVIEAGDFCYAHPGDSDYLMPFSAYQSTGGSTDAGFLDIINNFMGIAKMGSPSGVTENVTVMTAGIFRMPLGHNQAVTVGAAVSAVSPHPSGAGVSNQFVEAQVIDTFGFGTTVYLGTIVKTETSAVSFVDFSLRTRFSGATNLTYDGT
ncbi:hypothetical protein LCGC14_0570290 [marine sediment metagenome]|uniref:Uncharacterized protein n=1 Tax=marine sediment metagenome TaxID=412755 RepID=A0A0F9S305_9ZZZZ|nr:hypothetical protein [Pricia sp.]